MILQKEKYKLFTKADFINIVGKDLDELMENEDTNNASEYLITYVSNQIMEYIMKRTGRRLFKADVVSSTDYDLYFGFRDAVYKDEKGNERHTAMKLNDTQKEMLKLACVYQADYILTNGSTERMSGISLSTRNSVLKKEELASYEICDISVSLLTNAGLLYAGLGVGTNAWFK